MFIENCIPEANIKKEAEEQKSPSEQIGVTYLDVNVPFYIPLIRLNYLITREAEQNGASVLKGSFDGNKNVLNLKIGFEGRETHQLVLTGLKKLPVISIIVDDCGNGVTQTLEKFLKIKCPVNFSVLPFLGSSGKVAELADEAGHDVLLHLPMEPDGYPVVNPGEGAVLTEDSEDVIRKKLEVDFLSVSHAIGANNHMGSKASNNVKTVKAVLSYMKDHDYIFVDSRTSSSSLIFALGKEAGVNVLENYMFLDNDNTFKALQMSMMQLIDYASEHGQAIGICHARDSTIKYLEKELPRLHGKKVYFMHLTELADCFKRS